jgi:hypothetical protein
MAVSKDPFGAIAKKADSAGSKKTNKIAATVTKEVMNAVDTVIAHKAEIARLEAEQKSAEATIIDHVRPQQDDKAYAGNYSKTFSVEGSKGSAVNFTTSDKFSVSQEENVQEELQKLLGKNYDNCFESKRTITLKSEAAENKAFIDKLQKALTSAGMSIGEAFDVTEKTVAKQDLDRNQYTFVPKDKLDTFRSLVKQYKPAVK